jgi:hypothetical protein
MRLTDKTVVNRKWADEQRTQRNHNKLHVRNGCKYEEWEGIEEV